MPATHEDKPRVQLIELATRKVWVGDFQAVDPKEAGWFGARALSLDGKLLALARLRSAVAVGPTRLCEVLPEKDQVVFREKRLLKFEE